MLNSSLLCFVLQEAFLALVTSEIPSSGVDDSLGALIGLLQNDSVILLAHIRFHTLLQLAQLCGRRSCMW